MLEDFPSSRQPVWRLALQEAIAFAASGLLLPFGASASRRRTPRRRDQRTVVLIHGHLSNRSLLFPLAGYLRLLGLEQVLTFNYPSTLGVERAARDLREFLRRHVRGGRIDLVCHSLGGLVALSSPASSPGTSGWSTCRISATWRCCSPRACSRSSPRRSAVRPRAGRPSGSVEPVPPDALEMAECRSGEPPARPCRLLLEVGVRP